MYFRILVILLESRVFVHLKRPASLSLDRGLIPRDRSNGVAGKSSEKDGLLLYVAVSDGEGDQVNTAGKTLQISVCNTQEVCDEPSGQKSS